MTPERWQELKLLFGNALQMAVDDRAALVARTRGRDQALAAELEALLESEANAGAFLEPRAYANAAVEAPLHPIGAYALLREIGRGGMGVLYLAERVDQAYRRQVAIKILTREAGSDSLVARFKNERQILAALTHPNIAALLDGGATDDGRPFIVMEYVEGVPIDRFCANRDYSTSQRLELFLLVCGAVQYAHGRLVVHRDLKPDNILVRQDAQPKLLDFGIAKLLEGGTAALEQTAPEQRFLTPAFASPEHIRGEPVTTASDVYSLGVILYVLLTGQRPYRNRRGNLAQLAKAISEEQPSLPSAAVALTGPGPVGTEPGITRAKLSRRLRGDLDAIVLKALRREPENRYGSVEQLSADIRRHLDGAAVLARRGTTWYRANKFIARHRRAVAAGAVIAASLSAGIVQTSRERAKAERRFNDVRRLANSFLFEFDGAIRFLPGSTKARQLVVERAQQYLDGLVRESAGDASLQAELATAYSTLADIQGGNNASLGDASGAVRSLRTAIRIREALAVGSPRDLDAAVALATTLTELARMLERHGDLQESATVIHRSLDLATPLVQKHPNRTTWKTLAMASDVQAMLTEDEGRFDAALQHRQTELALFERIASADPGDISRRRNVAVALRYVGGVLERLNRAPEATELLARAVAIDSARVEANSNDALAKQDLAFSESAAAANLEKTGHAKEALALVEKTLSMEEEISAADPANVTARTALESAHLDAGRLHRSLGQTPEGHAEILKARSILKALIEEGGGTPSIRSQLGRTDSELGDVQREWGRDPHLADRERVSHWMSARSWYQESEEIRVSLARKALSVPVYFAVDGVHNAEQLKACEEDLAAIKR